MVNLAIAVCTLTQEETLRIIGVVAGLSYFGGPAVSHSLDRSRVHVCVSIINEQTTDTPHHCYTRHTRVYFPQ